MSKIIKTQFPFPGLDTLTNTYGNSSPMNLAWTFFGFSKGYNFLIGFFELLGMLLIYRRTVTLGALISLGTTINIMAINYFYDVPVKILSTALVVLCIFLLLPNIKQIWNFFVMNTYSKLTVFNSSTLKRAPLKGIIGIKIAFISIVFFITIKDIKSRERIIGDTAIKTPLYGIYEVETFVMNSDTLSPLLTDNIRWRQLVVNWPGNARIRLMDNTSYYTNFKVDTLKERITIGHENSLNYKTNYKNQLIISGEFNQDSILVTFNSVDLRKFKLINRDFRWISEVPFNE
ncbi:hypothetical protein [Pedobacter arcticus]|uniref:hypothetical protein n=1 Tax=Pedobacter arcticus TaxID=752140 RepID=UPI0012B64BD5|nr:hypothetical protein [Pedobacter arcticus]